MTGRFSSAAFFTVALKRRSESVMELATNDDTLFSSTMNNNYQVLSRTSSSIKAKLQLELDQNVIFLFSMYVVVVTIIFFEIISHE
jgi:hypothetical protein